MKLTHWTAGGSDTLCHWCPACERLHVIPPNRWTRTGPDDRPSYSPSFLQYDAFGKGKNCHYILHDGNIMFCGDSWHGRADTVPMPDIPPDILAHLTDAIFSPKPRGNQP